ncbi:hypothetical protein TrRE_jg5658 [Triparma retinervis]|uniref:Uncharacterized protein n=1 Tax=Triparma retinervis TaxID=2557542 RepID=A0A9W7AK15_9STRA|nr:hypothetical protein TrRE_jg5658 [Triparma retinervis]
MWNAINNVEGRLGFSSLAVLPVLGSAYNAASRYRSASPVAGNLLGGTCLWITVATALIWNTWWINKRGAKGVRDYLLPMRETGEGTRTKFVWEKR